MSDYLISKYFKDSTNYKISQFGSGLINRTFFLQHSEGEFLVQEINHQIFQDVNGLMNNIQIVGNHLRENNYPKSILTILPTLSNQLFYKNENGKFWRVFYFMKNTKSYNTALTEDMVFKAAKDFGEFLFFLNKKNDENIVDTIPDFHNTELRFQQLELAIQNNKADRVKSSQSLIDQIFEFSFLIKKIKSIEDKIPKRLVHNDMKINNLLFNQSNEVEAIIDWDTIMNGNVLYDFGDMVRTMACTEDENSRNFSNIKINKKYLEKIIEGFTISTDSFLSEIEKENLISGAQWIIFEQAIRFLTDHLNGDIYYNITFTNQNFYRVKNQIILLDDLMKCDL